MKKGLIRKGLVFGVIVLFIGVGIQPVFANELPITTTLDREEDCIECQESDGYSNLRVKILLIRLKAIKNIVSLITGEDYELILDSPPTDRPICDYIYNLYHDLLNRMNDLFVIAYEYIDNEQYIIAGIYLAYFVSFGIMKEVIKRIYTVAGCGYLTP